MKVPTLTSYFQNKVNQVPPRSPNLCFAELLVEKLSGKAPGAVLCVVITAKGPRWITEPRLAYSLNAGGVLVGMYRLPISAPAIAADIDAAQKERQS